MEVSNLVHCDKHYKQHKQLATFKSWYKNSFNGGLFINNIDEMHNLMDNFRFVFVTGCLLSECTVWPEPI